VTDEPTIPFRRSTKVIYAAIVANVAIASQSLVLSLWRQLSPEVPR
jgi:hypothetical protein